MAKMHWRAGLVFQYMGVFMRQHRLERLGKGGQANGIGCRA